MLTLVTLIASLFILVYFYFHKQYDYWRRMNIPFEPPMFPLGNFKQPRSKNFGVLIRELYDKSKNERFYGLWFFHSPTLLINDLDLVKDVLVKDFVNFHDHGFYYDEKVDPLSANLFSIEGSKWRNIRAQLTPIFTPGKMKMMFPTLKKCSDELRDVLRRDEGVLEMKEIIARFSTDVILSCGFGIEANSLKNPDAMFRAMGRKTFEPTWEVFFRGLSAFIVPSIGRILKLRSTPKKVADFFITAMRDAITFRESNGVKRNDFLQLLMQLMNKGYIEDADSPNDDTTDKTKFTFEEAITEAFVFFIGGFETISTTIQFALYELAMNPLVQYRLREEVLEGLEKSNGELTYEGVHNMDYLGRVIQETLRKHPPASFLSRVCTKPYKIPGTEIVLEKGTSITIPNYGFQMDERYFPEPEKFDPDRFLEKSKNSRNPFAYLPFGDGPRVCIGQRFAMMEMRTAVAAIISKFTVSPAEGKTPAPVVYDPRSFFLSSKGGMYLKITSL